MLSVLAVTFPFFALVLCGWLAARTGVVPLSAIGGLNTFVLYFALPCLLYRFGAGTPLAQLLDPVVAGVYFGCALVLVGDFTTDILMAPPLAPRVTEAAALLADAVLEMVLG